ncbi:MAG: type VI secretion system baseplate subunit TssE [Planctomycetales bacterium]|nr:type VI secretion system baseplate subunit TssE [Planctomycetales bacterium]MCA9168964.1 type VI secretion system baseplate subunit TssE [Planctomycetales bacterium]
MARVRDDQALVASVLDRLLDDDPQTQVESPRSRNMVMRDMKQSVCRDLENLLNTRWRLASFPPALDELTTSLVNYGIPDFTGANMSQPTERAALRRTIEAAIIRYEPRFKTVRVTILDEDDDSGRTLRFKIEALMHAEPAPEPVVFDSQLEPATSTFEVKMGAK